MTTVAPSRRPRIERLRAVAGALGALALGAALGAGVLMLAWRFLA
ncbi:MAG: hypothetical protein AB7V42_01190 [Thermoleophilia bacterium]